MFEFSGKMSRRSLLGEFYDTDDYGLKDFVKGEIDGFYDIGANVGLVSLQARMFFRDAVIHALEPSWKTYELLSRNMQYFNVKCHHAALGDGNIFYLQRPRISSTQQFTSKKPNDEVEQCKSMTIKQIFETLKVPGLSTFITIDCEGGEQCLMTQDIAPLLTCKRVAIETHGKRGSPTMVKWLIDTFQNSHVIELKNDENEGINTVKMTRKD